MTGVRVRKYLTATVLAVAVCQGTDVAAAQPGRCRDVDTGPAPPAVALQALTSFRERRFEEAEATFSAVAAAADEKRDRGLSLWATYARVLSSVPAARGNEALSSVLADLTGRRLRVREVCRMRALIEDAQWRLPPETVLAYQAEGLLAVPPAEFATRVLAFALLGEVYFHLRSPEALLRLKSLFLNVSRLRLALPAGRDGRHEAVTAAANKLDMYFSELVERGSSVSAPKGS